MKKNSNKLMLTFTIFVLSGCVGTIDKNTNGDVSIKSTKVFLSENEITEPSIVKWLKKNNAICENFMDSNKKPLIEKNIIKCLDKAYFEQSQYQLHAPKKLTSHLSKKFRAFKLSKEALTETLKVIAYKYGSNTKFIELLIKDGAETNTVMMRRITNGNSSACETSMLILKNNKKLYRNSFSGENISPSFTDLHHLVDPRFHRLICPDVAKQLISYNHMTVNAKDNDGNTPLHYFLTNFAATFRNVELAKILMTKENVNAQTSDGLTPLHNLLMYSYPGKEDLLVVKAILALGGKLTLKNRAGNTAQDLIIKRNDLVGVLKTKI